MGLSEGFVDTAAFADEFWRKGYLVIPGFFDSGLMDEYNQLALDHFGEHPQHFHNEEFLSKAATEVIPWFPQSEGVAAFDRIETDERLQSLTHAILGDGWKSQYCMVMYSAPESKGQAWHQDCACENPRRFNLNRLVYTHDIPPESGGQVLVMPGSHLRGEITAGDGHEDLPEQMAFSPGKGTLMLVHGHTWHRVLPVKGNCRISTNYRAAGANTPEDITDVCVYRNMRYKFSTSEVVQERI